VISRLDHHKDQAGAWDVLTAASGELAFDIGANIGQAARVLAAGFKKVIAFEPCIESFEILTVEAAYNVTPIQLAVSSASGRVELEEHAVSISTGQLTTSDGLHWGPKVGSRTVPSRTLDSLADDFGLPDFVKIDTEGHEVEVVRGGLGCLRHIPGVIIEVHRAENETLIRELLPDRDWTLLIHDLRISPPIRQNHFWMVSR
jgi:FkbM family methyltransferase